jgi:hypothetical protein
VIRRGVDAHESGSEPAESSNAANGGNRAGGRAAHKVNG